MEKILIVGANGKSTRILYNRLKEKYNVNVIIEDKISKTKFYKYRIKKIGIVTVVGQIIFSIYIKLYLEKKSLSKIKSLYLKYKLYDSPIPKNKIDYVKSINSNIARRLIESHSSIYVIVSGTRIIGKKTLTCTQTKFLNIHAGITPSYRGVHGGYWALVNNESDLCGVTLHSLDEGVETGSIIGHQLITPSNKDNFLVYPVLQLVEGLKMLEVFLNSKANLNKITTYQGKPLSSKQYYHPTLWEYIYYRLINGVK